MWKDLAPDIFRQRLLIEGYYQIDLDEEILKEYLKKIVKTLELKAYADPVIHCSEGIGKEVNQGYEGFIPLIDSGISVYVWERNRFLSVMVYACKQFSVEKAVEFTKKFFNPKEIVWKEI